MSSIIATISGLSLQAKIFFAATAVLLMGGGAAVTTLIIVNNSVKDDKVVSTTEDVISQNNPQDITNNDEQNSVSDPEPTANNNTTPEPAQSTAEQNSSAPATPETPATPAPAAPETPATPAAPPTPQADYNLNDKYIYDYTPIPFFTDDTYSTIAEYKAFFGIEKFAGRTPSCNIAGSQPYDYAQAMGYVVGVGCGGTIMTWEEAVAQGRAVDEAVCSRFGLSCGRW